MDQEPHYSGESIRSEEAEESEEEGEDNQDYRMEDSHSNAPSELNNPYALLAPNKINTQPTKRIPADNRKRFKPFEKIHSGATVDIQDIYNLNVEMLEQWYKEKPEEVKSSVLLGRNFNEAVKETRQTPRKKLHGV